MSLNATAPAEIRSEHAELGANQYGKSENRLVHIDRQGPVHHITDFNVSSQLRGKFDEIHTHGDNTNCVPTDTQKNIVFSLARDGVGTPEQFGLKLASHFLTTYPELVEGGRWEIHKYGWDRIVGDNGPHDFSFVRTGSGERTAIVQAYGEDTYVLAGIKDLTVLKSSGSEFVGYNKCQHTTLPEATDRIMATDVTAWWEYNTTDVDFDAVYEAVQQSVFTEFAERHSTALQQTMWAIGVRVIEQHPEINSIRLSCPNNHHFTVDLSPFGQDNPNVVFYAADRPYGNIEATIQRKGTTPNERAWNTVPAFA